MFTKFTYQLLSNVENLSKYATKTLRNASFEQKENEFLIKLLLWSFRNLHKIVNHSEHPLVPKG